MVAVVIREDAGIRPRTCSEGSTNGLPAQCVAVQKFQGDTCLPSQSQCKRSGVMFKGRLFLDKAEEAEVASLGSVCGSVYSFPVKAGPAWPKSGSLAGFNGRMM